MDSSTETNTPTIKRTRFTETTEKSRPSASNLDTPKDLLFSFIRGTIASLPPNLTPILDKTCTSYMSLQLKIRHKELQVIKLKNNADRMPTSARLKFELKVSKTASKTEEFVTLAKETEDLVVAMREQLKTQIIKAAELEILVFKRDLTLDFSPPSGLLLPHTYMETLTRTRLMLPPSTVSPSTISSFCATCQSNVTNLRPNTSSFTK